MERASMYVVWSCSFIFDLGNPDNVIMVSNCKNEGGGVGEGVGIRVGFLLGFGEGFGEGFAEGFGEGSNVGAIVVDSEYSWADETCPYEVIIDK
jgi:hypothetical protein